MGRQQVNAQLRNHGHEPEPKQLAAVPDLEEEEVSLDDPVQQHKIFNPEPREVELSFEKIQLFPYSIRDRRRAYGFAVRVTSDAAQNANSQTILGMRIAALLNASETLEQELLRLTAIARRPAGELKAAQIEKLAAELGGQCSPDDMVVLFAQICELSGVKKQVPKSPSATKGA
jgi:hypothetical protein